MPAEQRPRFLDIKLMTIAECESLGTTLATQQRDVMFQIGDLYRYAEARWPDKHHQIWPEWASPGMLQRAAGVCKAYPTEEDRRHNVTYTQYMQVAGKPNRHEILAAIESEGLTTDESRKSPKPESDGKPRWLLAVDVNYYLHRFWHSGAGVESAMSVASWIQRTVYRLQQKGLTDVACCFDAPRNHRKLLTETWEAKYKDRPPKDPELSNQLKLVRDLLQGHGFCCVSVDEMEADDVMASYAKRFIGRVTLLTQDKDCRQCLSATCNMLLDVTWNTDDTTGESIADYKWLTAATHTRDTGIRPERWIEYQCLMGDNVDGIKGAVGIGAKGAATIIQEFGSADAAIAAAKAGDERLKPKQRESLIEFESRLEITRQLVTLRTDLAVPMTTRLPVPAEDSMQSDEIDRLAGLMP